jgi:hypothetical protein
MNLNLPFFESLRNAKNILIAGAGGGFDVFAGLPIYHELHNQGRKVYLANYSFTDLENASCVQGYKEAPALYSFGGKVLKCPSRKDKPYFPEGYLAESLSLRGYDSNMPRTVFAFPKVGVAPLREAYSYLVKRYELDAIILVDGGIDSIMTGNEAGCGTILEDTVSLAAVRDVDVPVKILATIGFGTEFVDNLNHYRALESMAELTKCGGCLGVCGLTPEMSSFQFMKEMYSQVVKKKDHHHSHITPEIVRAVEGEWEYSVAGDEIKKFVSPLTSIYWFWSPNIVASRNVLIDSQFCQTRTFTDVNVLYRQKLQNLKLKPDVKLVI